MTILSFSGFSDIGGATDRIDGGAGRDTVAWQGWTGAGGGTAGVFSAAVSGASLAQMLLNVEVLDFKGQNTAASITGLTKDQILTITGVGGSSASLTINTNSSTVSSQAKFQDFVTLSKSPGVSSIVLAGTSTDLAANASSSVTLTTSGTYEFRDSLNAKLAQLILFAS